MISNTRLLQTLAFAIAVLCHGSHAFAQSADTSGADAAFELYDQAKVEFNEGRFESAIELLDEALLLHTEPILLYNLARAYEGLGDEEAALAYYEDYLEEDPEAENRGAVEGRVRALRESIASAVVAPAPQTEVRPGPWIVLGSGAVLALSGLIPGAMSRSTRDGAADEANARDALAEVDKAEGQALAANVLFGVGGAVALGGLIWVIVGGRRSVEDAAVQLDIAPGGLQVRGAF